ncbi:MAG: hypothetical protein WA634_07460 [Silvibacterium sp.]
MPDSGSMNGAVNCDELRPALKHGRALTAAQQAHMDGCENCLEAWLDATVTQALDAKPEVAIPADFAARVAAGLKVSGTEKRVAAQRSPHWGLLTASLLVAAGMIAVAVADPNSAHTRMGIVFMALVVTEIAGIALWLGTRRPGMRASRGHSRWSWN